MSTWVEGRATYRRYPIGNRAQAIRVQSGGISTVELDKSAARMMIHLQSDAAICLMTVLLREFYVARGHVSDPS
ncbi:hypothetical protein [Neorhizobium sp. JUb45]|uniref:hypothetical protein n=1 Tax=unclassified Neorhizobium TaxID=2629175 RepID=UPI00104EFE43|nr:hypothetical protein [Neorhizobium sp. JUb45]